jgi:hypothetical protein
MALTFNPHPLGCPIGLAVTPAEMTELVPRLAMQLRGLVHLTVHVINPRKGDSYPILNVFADESDTSPRVVLFPGWEDNRRTEGRRIGFARQQTLLQRIHEAGVEGEGIEEYRGKNDAPGPLVLSLGVPNGGMRTIASDVQEYLGDCLRLTWTELPFPVSAGAAPRPPLAVLRVYAPAGEDRARLVLFPGWFGDQEGVAGAWLNQNDREALLGRVNREPIRELPGETLTLG